MTTKISSWLANDLEADVVPMSIKLDLDSSQYIS